MIEQPNDVASCVRILASIRCVGALVYVVVVVGGVAVRLEGVRILVLFRAAEPWW